MARPDTIVGLDIGRHSVKAVWAVRRLRGAAVKRTELLRLPPDQADSGVLLGPWLEKMELAKVPCVIGLRGDQTVFQPFQLAADDPRPIEQAAGMEVVRFNEMAAEEMCCSFAPFSIEPGDKRLLLAMTRPTIQDQLIAFARERGLQVLDIIPTPVALFGLMEAMAGKHTAPHMYINMGHLSSEVAIGSGPNLMFARAFGSGGQTFTSALARSANVTMSRVETMKMEKGSLTDQDPATAEVLRPAADTWLSEVQSCLSVYQSLFPGKEMRPQRVVLAGGAAALPGLAAYVGAKLGIETVSLPDLPGRPQVDNPGQFAVAAGLAIAGVDKPLVPISLLPARIRDELAFRRQKAFWIAAGVAAGLILAVSLTGGYRDLRRQEARLSFQKASLRKRQQLVAEIESIKKKDEHLIALAMPVQRLLYSGPLMRDLIGLVAASIHSNDWITMICDADSYFTPEPFAADVVKRGMRDPRRKDKAKTDGPPEPGFQRLVIEGHTQEASFTTVKALIATLAAADFIESADLLSDDQLVLNETAGGGARQATRFVIDVKVRKP